MFNVLIIYNKFVLSILKIIIYFYYLEINNKIIILYIMYVLYTHIDNKYYNLYV